NYNSKHSSSPSVDGGILMLPRRRKTNADQRGDDNCGKARLSPRGTKALAAGIQRYGERGALAHHRRPRNGIAARAGTRPSAILSYRSQAAPQGIKRISLALLRLKLASLIRVLRVH